MNKHQLLRQHLVAAVPALAVDPQRLLVFVDAGGLNGSYRPGLSFEYRYTLELIMRDFSGPPEGVMLPLLQWLTRHQPELLATPANRKEIVFKLDMVSGDLAHLTIKLPLTERVRVQRDGEGNLQLEHLPEPPAEPEHADALRGGALIANGEVIAQLPALIE